MEHRDAGSRLGEVAEDLYEEVDPRRRYGRTLVGVRWNVPKVDDVAAVPQRQPAVDVLDQPLDRRPSMPGALLAVQ